MITDLLNHLETEADDQVPEGKRLRETPIGDKNIDEILARCKVAIGYIGNFVRLKSALSNEIQVRCIMKKLEKQMSHGKTTQRRRNKGKKRKA